MRARNACGNTQGHVRLGPNRRGASQRVFIRPDDFHDKIAGAATIEELRARSGKRPPITQHALAAIEAAIFFRCPVAMIAPFLKIGLGPLRQEHAPRRLKG